ncbi:MAG: hypothetical protein Q9169_000725 [Polycauliona sp. 2 TL-2023]
MLAYERGPEKLVKDYLTALRTHAERVLRNKLPQSALTSIPIEFVITVPAVWSDRAQAATRRCAEQAGMGTGSSLHVISEPEAAAMYALDAMDPHNIKVGDTFVLCDAGGGTVDLISYKVSALKPSLQIAEAAPGSGSLSGSTFLNRIFKKFLTDRFGNDPNFDEDVLEEAMKRFEVTVKRSFNVPGLRNRPALGVSRGRLCLKGSDVKSIFDPVIKEIVTLVNGQIDATKARVKAVLLVGGFGQSVYLRDSIRQAVASKGIEVMQSPNGWTAIVRGALMRGLMSTNRDFTAVRIGGRSARKSYGVRLSVPFDKSKHDGHERVMDWFISKGDTVEENKPKRIYYTQYYHTDSERPTLVPISIFTCSDIDNAGPSMHQDSRVQKLVVVSADLGRIPFHNFPTEFGADDALYYRIEYCIEVTCYSAYTKYELIYDGFNYGPVTAEYV